MFFLPHLQAWLGQTWQEEHKGSCGLWWGWVMGTGNRSLQWLIRRHSLCKRTQNSIFQNNDLCWVKPINFSFSYSLFFQEGWFSDGCASLEVTKSSSAALLCIPCLRIRNYGFSSAFLSSLPQGEDAQVLGLCSVHVKQYHICNCTCVVSWAWHRARCEWDELSELKVLTFPEA